MNFRRLYLATLVLGLFVLGIFSAQAQETQTIDTDSDGLSDQQELTIYHTSPLIADTDNDGFSDGAEIKTGYSPLHGKKLKLRDVDSDKDGLTDDWEIILGTDLKNPDSDNDGHLDGQEVMTGYDPTSTSTVKVSKQIIISLIDQTLTYSFNDKVLDKIKISSGTKYYPTPKGEFTVMKKVPRINYIGSDYNYPNTKWNLLFLQKKLGYYIHGAYWHHNFGHPMSHGCVNVSYDNMQRLYNWADTETKITIK